MTDFPPQRLCSGCGACSAVCQVDAIRMVGNSEGFTVPNVDAEKCVRCGRCEQVCPVLHAPSKYDDGLHGLVARRRVGDMRSKSSSGGIFLALAERFVADGGVVYGASFSDDFRSVRHVRVERSFDLEKLARSKYAQSVCEKRLYRQIAKDAREGRKVLFSGMPCQVAGVKRYLGVADNVFFVDLICNSVPSPFLFAKFSDLMHHKCGIDRALAFKMRADDGFRPFLFQLENKKGRWKRFPALTRLYVHLWMGGFANRQSCENCMSKGRSGSDLTIGDAWGVQQYFAERDDGRGLSSVIVNTPRGGKLFDLIRPDCICTPVPPLAILKGNASLRKCLVSSSSLDEARALLFRSLMHDENWLPVAKKVSKMRFIDRLGRKILRVIKLKKF